MLRSLVGSEMCIRDRSTQSTGSGEHWRIPAVLQRVFGRDRGGNDSAVSPGRPGAGEGGVGGDARDEEDDTLRLVRREMELRLSTVETLSAQTGLDSEGLVGVWLDGAEGFDKVQAAMWHRLQDRYGREFSEVEIRQDKEAYFKAVGASVGAAGLVEQGKLDGQKIAALAAAIHEFVEGMEDNG
eukprot:TRINITY_DN6506_c0_g1_i1.p1 TRINITY_DN6506_c0_g1~~TRINITY_DN6506_c0_g1_i1.p1  ORF type:complete len:184 (+),score=44.69 TRINITY_DN6506_c0_g1_i1:140-691(+)